MNTKFLVLSAGTSPTTEVVLDKSMINLFERSKAVMHTFLGKAIVAIFAIVLLTSLTGLACAQGSEATATEVGTTNNLPEISISGEGPTFEGEDAVFTLISSIASKDDFVIDLNLDSSDFIFGSLNDYNQVTMRAGETIVVHAIETDDDQIDEADGSIRVALQESATYDIDSNASAATITILDNDPLVWITAGDPIVEGENAVFTVHSATPAYSQLTIQLGVSDDNDDFITGIIPNTATIATGALTGTLVVYTDDDQTDESDGTIRVTLAEDTNIPVTYSPISSDTGKHSALIVVRDNDVPATNQTDKIIASIAANSSSVTEGETAVFTVTLKDDSTKQPVNVEENVIVKVLVSDGTSNFMQNQDPSSSIFQATIVSGSSSALLTIPTIDDTFNEDNGVIEAVILGSYDYFLGETKSASIQIEDNDDEIPTISITNHNTIVVEGGKAKFRLLTTSIPDNRIFVNVSMRQTGNFFGNPGNRRIGLKSGNIKAPDDEYQKHFRRFNIHTYNDQTDEADGSITVTIKPGTGYRIDASAKTASVLVKDNDGPKPTLSVVATKTTITEGESIEFKIVSSQPISDKFYFFYSLHSNEENVATNVTRTKYQGLAFFDGTTTTNATEKIFTFNTIDDEIIRSGGKVVLKLKSRRDKSYQISTNRAIVRIVDNDIISSSPIVNLTTETPSIEEGQTAALTLESNQIAPASGIMVNYTKSQIGDFFANGFSGSGSVKIWAGGSSEDFEFTTHDDDVDEVNGSFTITLTGGIGYTLGTNSIVTISVLDNDVLPVVSLSPTTSTIDEGGVGKIVFSLDRVAPARGLNVSYSISQIGSILDPFVAGITEVLIPAGVTSKEFGFRTNLDYIYQPNSSFTVSLNRSSTYSLGATSVATVSVNERFYPPRLTMTDAKAVYDSSGAFAEFYIRSDSRFVGTKTINVLVNGVTHTDQNRPIPSSVDMQGSGGAIPYTITNPGTILRVPIHQNQISERTGRIMATISAPTNPSDYRFGNAISRWIDITAFTAQSSSLPEISVSVVSRQVFGEEKKYFNVSTSSPSPNPININFTAFFDTNTLKYYNDHFHLQQGPKVFILPAGASEYEFDFEEFMLFGQTGAQFKEAGGKVEFTLLNGNDYLVAPSPNNKATITRSRDYELSGISITAGESVHENWLYVKARFKLQATSATQSDRTINVNVTESNSNFLLLTGQSQIVLPAGEVETLFNVAIENDEVAEPDGVITATILPGTGYTVATTQNSASVNVFDDDGTPNVYILSESDDPYYRDWIEGATRRIKFRSSGVPTGTVVKFRITDGGTNIYKGTEIRTVSWRTHTNYLDIDTNFDIVPEDDATITIEVIPGTGYEKASVNGEVSFTVYDDDQINRISVQALESTITEGQYAQFQLSASITKSNLYGVHFILDDGSGDFIGTIPTRGSTSTNYSYFEPYQLSESEGGIGFSANEITRLIRVPTVDDNNDELDGTITLSIYVPPERAALWAKPDVTPAYVLFPDQSKNSATVTVLDNDEAPILPVVTLSASTTSMEEGSTATMTLTSSMVAPTDGLMINYQKSQTGNFFASSFSGSDSVTILAGETTKDITFTTQDDTIDEPDGNFTVTLTPNTNYSFGATFSQTVNVSDNDDPPVISIANAPDVVEGTDFNAQFAVTASHPASENRIINVLVTGAAGSTPSGQIPTTVTLEANSVNTVLNIPIQNDNIVESDSVITVTISAPTNLEDYQIGTPNSAQVNVVDDEYIVSLSTSAESIEEGENATFTFLLNRSAPAGGFNVSYQLNKSLNYSTTETEQVRNKYSNFDRSDERLTITVPAGETSQSIELTSYDNNINNANGYYTVRLNWSSDYRLGAEDSAQIEIVDNDATPVITVSGGIPVTEGTDSEAEFTFTASILSSLFSRHSSISIPVMVAGPRDAVFLGYNRYNVHLKPYEREAVLRIPVPDNQFDEHDYQISATILPRLDYGPPLYFVGNPDTAQVSIIDQDESTSQLPDITLRAVYPVVNEGDDVVYEMTASFAPDSDLNIDYYYSGYLKILNGHRYSLHGSGGQTTFPAGQTVHYLTRKTAIVDKSRLFQSTVLDGMAELIISSGVGYRVLPLPNDRSSVAIRRFETPSGISIIGGATSTESSRRVVFQITASESSQSDRIINVDVTSGNNNNFVVGTVQEAVTLPAGALNAQLIVSYIDDKINEQDEYITATLRNGSGYTIAQTKSSASILVLDDDADLAEITIYESKRQRYEHWIEGHERSFTIAATSMPYQGSVQASSIDVRIRAVENGGKSDFLTSPFTKIVTIPYASGADGYSDYRFNIPVPEDSIAEEDGSITVSILPDDGYEISSTFGSQTSMIYDDDGDISYSIVAKDSSITEGEFARFQIITSKRRSQRYRIGYSLYGGIGDFIKSSSVIDNYMPATRNSKIFYVPTIDDEIDEPNGSVKVTLHSDNVIPGAQKSASIIVLDNDETPLPVFSIAPVNISVVESSPAQFRVTSSTASTSSVTIRVNVSQTGDILAGAPGETTFEFPALTTEQVFDIATEDDEVDEADGIITVTITNPTNADDYQVGSPSSAQVSVTDDDEVVVPTVSISPLTPTVTEGTPVHFDISILPTPTTPLDLNIGTQFSGDFFGTEIRRMRSTGSLTMTGAIRSTHFAVRTIDDDIDESDGYVIVTIQSGTGYQVANAPDQSSKIIVEDNDDTPVPAAADLPIATLTTNVGYVEEGQTIPVRFAISKVAPANGLDIRYRKSHTGDFVSSTFAGIATVRIFAGTTFTKLRLQTQDDNQEESNGSVTITLVNGDGYTLGALNSFSVEMLDNDGPARVSVYQRVSSYSEGIHATARVEFRTYRHQVVAEDTVINIEVFGATSFIPDGQIPTVVTIPANRNRVELRIAIEDDDVVDTDGLIYVRISDPTATDNYTVSGISQTHFYVRDNDEPSENAPEVSVTTISNIVSGSDGYLFRIVASHASDTDIYINVDIREADDLNRYSAPNIPRRLKLTAGTTAYELDLYSGIRGNSPGSTVVDGYAEVTIKRGIGYRVAASPDNSAMIYSRRYDAPTGISIVAGVPDLSEGNGGYPVLFQFTASSESQSDRVINFELSDGDSDFLQDGGRKQVRLPAGKTSVARRFALVDDDLDEPDGYVTATLLPGEGYTVASTYNTARIKVRDNDGTPVVYLDPYLTESSRWIEGQARYIAIYSSSKLFEGESIELRVTDSSGDLYTGDENVTLSRGSYTGWVSYYTYRIETRDDHLIEDDETITVEVVPSSSYDIASDASSATFTVYDDDDVNHLTIEALESTITEGEFAQFRLTPSTHRNRSYQIKFAYSQGSSNFIGEIFQPDGSYSNHIRYNFAESTGQFSFSSGEETRVIRIPTVDDSVDEADGQITFELLASNSGKSYTLSSDVTKNSVSVTVLDNDVQPDGPTLSIAPVATSVEEGEPAQFRITANTDSTATISVNINVAQTGDVLDGTSGNRTVSITATTAGSIIDIATTDDLISEPDGVITVSLVADDSTPATYLLNSVSSRQSAEVTVTDDEPLPEFGIAGATAAVLEPDAARFRLWTTTAHSGDVTVRINVSQTGNVLSGTAGETSTIMPAGERQTYIEIATENDDVIEDNGSITVTLLTDDHSPATYTLTSRTYRQTATVEVYDDDTTPTITIADATAVVEGTDTNATFTITTSHAVRDARAVNISVTGATNFIQSGQIPTLVTLTRLSLRTALQIPIEDDLVDEADGVITVTITDPTNTDDYQIGSSSSAEVSVSDNDVAPTISIADGTAVVEGTDANAVFVLTSSHAAFESRTINIAVSGATSFIQSGQIPTSVTLSSLSMSTELRIPIEDDEVDEADGIITVTISAPTNADDYQVGTPSSAQVSVSDDDEVVVPTVSISHLTPTVTEGTPVHFNISVLPTPTTPLDLNIGTQFSGDFFGTETRRMRSTGSLTITGTIRSGGYGLRTIDDDIDESDGYVIFTIQPGTGYQVASAPNNSSKITVEDNDEPAITSTTNLPIATITTNAGYITEGGTIPVRIAITQFAPANGLDIRYRKSHTGDFVSSTFAGIASAKISAGETFVRFRLPTQDDDQEEPHGTATISLENGLGYTVGTENSISLDLLDDDGLPRVRLDSYGQLFTEGTHSSVSIIFRSHRDVSEDTEINVWVYGATNYIPDSQIPTAVTILANTSRAVLEIPIHDDNVVELNDYVYVRIKSPSSTDKYVLGNNWRTRFFVRDNDEPSESAPEISVSTVSDYVDGNDGYLFRLTATHASDTDIFINVELIEMPYDRAFFRSPTNRRLKLAAGTTAYDLNLYSGIPINTARSTVVDGYAELTIKRGAGYRIAESPRDSAHIRSRRYDRPAGISIVAGPDEFYESAGGFPVRFQISASSVSQSDRIINVNVSDGDSDFISSGGLKEIRIPAGETTAMISLAIIDDDLDEPDGYITATVLPGDGYTVASTHNTARIKVRDDDGAPIVSLYRHYIYSSKWIEGQWKWVYVNSSSKLPEGESIELRITDGGSNLYTGPETVSLSDGYFTGSTSSYSHEIHTQDDELVEDDVTITVEILPSSAYQIAADGGSRTFTVYDDDEVNYITIEALNSTITEGEFAEFRLTPSSVRTNSYDVNFSYSQGGDFIGELYQEDGGWSHHIKYNFAESKGRIPYASGMQSRVFRIPTVDDSVDEADGQVTFELTASSDSGAYTLSSDMTKNSATVTVLDNDEVVVPTVSISSLSPTVTEGTPVHFHIDIVPTPTTPIDLNIGTQFSGDFFGNETRRMRSTGSLTITGRIRSGGHGLRTIDDDIDESDGYIIFTIQPGTGYQVADAPNNSSKITVEDNDDAPLPEFGITGATAAVLEPDAARFRLWTTTASSSDVTVRINVSQTGNVLRGTVGETTAIMPAGEQQTYLEIATEDDEVIEDNGSITVTILADDQSPATYALTSRTSRHSASVEVYDDDTTPTLTIADATAVVEGTDDYATFAITTSHAVRDTRDINILVTGATSFIESGQIPTSVKFTRLSLRTALQIPIEDDELDEADGIITVTITNPTNADDYQIGSSSSAQVSVTDNDDEMVISIADAAAVVEGTDSNAVFTLTASRPVSEARTINISVTGATRFIPTNQIPTTVTLEKNSTTAELSIPIEDDEIYDHFGYIFVELLPDSSSPAGYTMSENSASQRASGLVRDNETKPVISVAAVESPVIGPNPVQFKLSVSTAISFPVSVRYSVYGADNSLLEIETEITELVSIPALATEKIIEVSDYRFTSEHYEQSGTIAININRVLRSDSPYQITADTAKQSAEVKVMDDGSLPVISVVAVADTVNEPNPAQFKIISSKPPVQPLPVRIKVSYSKNVRGSGNYVNYSPVTILAGNTEQVLDIDIENDLVSGPNGYLFVQIVIDDDEEPTYRMTHDVYGAEAWVTVVDDDTPASSTPEITISTSAESIEEGQDIDLVVNSSFAVADPLVVAVNLNQLNSVDSVDANFIVGGLKRDVYFANGSTEETLTISTHDDKVDEPNGVVSISIAENSKYELGRNSTVNIAVTDNDIPVATIRTPEEDLSVPEGDSINFGVFLDPTPWHAIAVNVNVFQSSGGDFIHSEDLGNSTHTIGAGVARRIFTVRTIDDEVDEEDADITARIMIGDHYKVGDSTNSTGRNFATVTVTDNDEPPAVPSNDPVVLSISANKAQVNEGESVVFEVRADKSSDEPLPLNLKVESTSQDFLNFVNTNYAGYLSGLRYNARPHGVLAFYFTREDDNIDGEDFDVVVTLLNGEKYIVDPEQNTAKVVVIDNGVTKPAVSISPLADTIQEGGEASFLVRIANAISNDLDVKVRISREIEALVGTQYLENIVKIAANETTQLLTIPTLGNELDGPDSKVTATLQADARYILPTTISAQSASITVLDDDVPLVSIVAESDPVVEGAIARFGVTTAVEVVESLSVSVVVNQTGDVIAGGSGIETVHFNAGDISKIIEVQTTEDEIDEIEGRITATIIEPNDGKYQISEEKGSDSVDVADNDDPMISITPVADYITEGEVVQFTLTAKNREIDTELRININVTQTSDFMTWRIPRSTIFPAGKKITTIVISTIDDKKEQEDGEFRAEILAGERYRISSQNVATVAIEDNDTGTDTPTSTNEPRISVADKIMNSLLESVGINLEPEVAKPEISIVERNDEVAEGEVIRFAIQSSLTLGADLVIEISIDSPNDSISEVTPMRVTMPAGVSTYALELATTDDNKAESNELITLTINEQPTYTVSKTAGSASVTLTDHKDWQRRNEIARSNGVVIPELAGRLSAQSLNQISERIQQGFASEGQNVLQIAGSEKLTGILEQSGDAVNNDALLKDTLFNNSSFAFNLLPDSTGFESATTWGSGNQLEFQSQRLGNSSMSGEMLSSHLGLDVAFNEELITGFTGTYSDTQVDYTALDSTYEYDVQMTGFFPYIGWQNTGRADYLRIVAGLGAGEIGIRHEGNSWSTLASNLYTTEVSGGLQVFADNDASDNAVSALSLDSGLRTLRYFTEQDKDVVGYFDHRQSQAHLTLEGLYAKDLSNGSELIPTAAVGLQGLSDKNANKFGYIFESGVTYENPAGYTISGLGRTFFNSDDWSNDSQLQGTLAFDANYDDLGTTIDVTSSWGVAPATESDSMWERHIFTQNLAAESANSQTQVSTEFGYGLGILDGRGILTPYNKIDWSYSAQQTIEFGSRVAVGSGIHFELKAARENRESDEIDHQINFSGSFGW